MTLFDGKMPGFDEKLKLDPGLTTPGGLPAKAPTAPARKPHKFMDPSTALSNQTGKFNIKFYHLPTNRHISFKAFVTEFSDSYTSLWQEESVYGRMDPIPVFENTRRLVTLGFDMPAASQNEAATNLGKIDQFIQRLYPVYERINDFNVLSTAPVWRVKFGNLISKTNGGSGNAKTGGVICYIKDFSFTPDLEPGFILSKSQLYPKNINVSLSLTILHEITPGFIKKKFDGGSTKHNFPYGVGSKRDLYDEAGEKKRKKRTEDAERRGNQELAAAVVAGQSSAKDCDDFGLNQGCSLDARHQAARRVMNLKGSASKKYKKILRQVNKKQAPAT